MYEKFQQILRERRNQGETDEAIARTANTSHQHINRLINGSPEQFAKVKFETMLKLFPGIIRIMERDGQINQNNSPGAAAAIGGNATAQNESDLSRYRGRLMESIIDNNGICDSCKVKVLKILKDV